MDSATLAFLAAPFVASLILTGIHAYLGVHVVERGVIFVDLSLAQIAALGAAIAHPAADHRRRPACARRSTGSASGSRSSARSCSRRSGPSRAHSAGGDHRHLLCRGLGGAILAMSKATSESEHLKDMLVGNILAVSWQEVGETAALYGAIGLFHYFFRKQFLAISLNP